MRFGLIALSAALLSACASREAAPPQPVSAPTAAVVESRPQEPAAKIESQPLKHLAGRKLKPIPDRPLDVRTRCAFKDVQGGRGKLDLQVNKADVKRFTAEVDIPKQGICRFDMKEFEQTARLPNVVLSEPGSSCKVRMWEQGSNITVAFHACQAKCGGDAFSYLFPILIDARSGRCA